MPCPEVVTVSYIRPAKVLTLFSVEGDTQVEQKNTAVGFLTEGVWRDCVGKFVLKDCVGEAIPVSSSSLTFFSIKMICSLKCKVFHGQWNSASYRAA